MIDKKQLKEMINDVLIEMSAWMDDLSIKSKSSINLIMGTCAQESRMGTYFFQLGDGPAQGIFQMEPATENDIWENYLAYDPKLTDMVFSLCGYNQVPEYIPDDAIKFNLKYQIIMCRLHYKRQSERFPEADNILALAEYWKKYYNTKHGKGTTEEFVANYRHYIS